jgi:hypothetical protein
MSHLARKMKPSGNVRLQLLAGNPYGGRSPHHPLNVLKHAMPRPGLGREVNVFRLKNLPNLWRGLRTAWLAMAFGIPTHFGAVFLRVRRNGEWVELGLASLRVVTTTGVKFIADDFNNNGQDVSTMKFHGFGTGTTAEAVSQTALVTELTTEYVTNSTRPTGSQASATVSNDATYTTVGTLTPDSGGTLAITEHGIFSASSAGTMLDRSKFAAVNLDSTAGDSLTATYTLTLASGG